MEKTSVSQPSESAISIEYIQVVDFKFNLINNLMNSNIEIANNIGIKTGANISYSKKEEDNLILTELNIKMDLMMSDNILAHIESTIIGLFKFKNEFNERIINNIAAMLYSYLRPIVAQMSVMSKIIPIDLPPLNFSNLKFESKN
mgnify:CR=1 FL=1